MTDHIVTLPLPVGSYPATVYGEEVTLELHPPDAMTEYLRKRSVVPLLRERGLDVPLLTPPPETVAAGYISCPFETIARLGEIAAEEAAGEGFGADVEVLGRKSFGLGARAIFDGDIRHTEWGPVCFGHFFADIFWLTSFPPDAPEDLARLLCPTPEEGERSVRPGLPPEPPDGP